MSDGVFHGQHPTAPRGRLTSSRSDPVRTGAPMDKAAADYTQALAIDPNFADAYLNRGSESHFPRIWFAFSPNFPGVACGPFAHAIDRFAGDEQVAKQDQEGLDRRKLGAAIFRRQGGPQKVLLKLVFVSHYMGTLPLLRFLKTPKFQVTNTQFVALGPRNTEKRIELLLSPFLLPALCPPCSLWFHILSVLHPWLSSGLTGILGCGGRSPHPAHGGRSRW